MAPPAKRRAVLVAPLVMAALVTARPAGPISETLSGPIRAEVVAVIDGDTLEVRARIWLGQDVRIRVRLSGVDAPELKARCAAEAALAVRAKALIEAKVAGADVTLREVRYGKFAGRVTARVSSAAGEDLGQALLAAGLARSYEGGRRQSWCGHRLGRATR